MRTAVRGYAESDQKEFSKDSVGILQKACTDLSYLMERGYKIKGASVFVGNHYMLSERQRLSLVRTCSSKEDILLRRQKERTRLPKGETVCMDGFNTIITLEVALSLGLLLDCADGTIRDMAGLRGTYRIIDKTEIAVSLLLNELKEEEIAKAEIYLDSPVSNSGRLKQLIMEMGKEYPFTIEVFVIPDVDRVLETKENVITSDAIILNRCKSYYNMTRKIIRDKIPDAFVVRLYP
ncbi:MAG: DUF434 domain-containing protein [Lachnospiraceae bacterium]|nr:DUF434 domain-containing protein [Lachnospiraceae bacterium]